MKVILLKREMRKLYNPEARDLMQLHRTVFSDNNGKKKTKL
jgi:hypothetical protein